MLSNLVMDPIEPEFEALMDAVDADLEGGNPESALARLEEFIRKHARPGGESDLPGARNPITRPS